MSLTLSAEQENFIQAQIATGHFQSPSEVIDAALELLELGEAASPAQRSSPEALRLSIMDGLNQAVSGSFTSDDEVQALLASRQKSSTW